MTPHVNGPNTCIDPVTDSPSDDCPGYVDLTGPISRRRGSRCSRRTPSRWTPSSGSIDARPARPHRRPGRARAARAPGSIGAVAPPVANDRPAGPPVPGLTAHPPGDDGPVEAGLTIAGQIVGSRPAGRHRRHDQPGRPGRRARGLGHGDGHGGRPTRRPERPGVVARRARGPGRQGAAQHSWLLHRRRGRADGQAGPGGLRDRLGEAGGRSGTSGPSCRIRSSSWRRPSNWWARGSSSCPTPATTRWWRAGSSRWGARR